MIGTRTLVIGELVASKKSVKKQKQYSGKAHLVDFESLALGALADADITVASRYGRWDPLAGSVVAP
jgi:hypothetical protein